MRRIAILAAVLALPMAPPASGAELHGCFARTYSADHLAAHPDQRVTDMRLDLTVAGSNQFAGNGFALDVKTRTLREWHRAEGTCSGSGGERLCTVPCRGDSGFVVRAEASGSILIDLERPFGEIALTVCDGQPHATLDSGLDDKRFRLHPVACGG